MATARYNPRVAVMVGLGIAVSAGVAGAQTSRVRPKNTIRLPATLRGEADADRRIRLLREIARDAVRDSDAAAYRWEICELNARLRRHAAASDSFERIHRDRPNSEVGQDALWQYASLEVRRNQTRSAMWAFDRIAHDPECAKYRNRDLARVIPEALILKRDEKKNLPPRFLPEPDRRTFATVGSGSHRLAPPAISQSSMPRLRMP